MHAVPHMIVILHVCVSNDTFPTLIFRTHLREWVHPLSWLDPVWLTHSSSLHSSFFFLPTTPTIFWFIGVIFLRWWSTEDVRQNLQRVFMVCSTDTLAWLNSYMHMQMEKRAHIEQIQTVKHAHMPFTYTYAFFHNDRIVHHVFPVDTNELWNISAWFMTITYNITSIWYNFLEEITETHITCLQEQERRTLQNC